MNALTYLHVISGLACVLLYRVDKARAIDRKPRISEFALLLPGLFGGWPAALLAQQLFRHKTKKLTFQLKFWATVILSVALEIAFLHFAKASIWN